MIVKGKGGEKKDEAAAFAWCKKAADQGFGPAETQLAAMYEHGEGVTADSEQALVWSTLAAKQQEKIAERQKAALIAKMSPEAVARAQKSASDWKPVLSASR
jgi:TPR repeat protein